MHQRAVVCTMCGGKFFPASLGFHQKACEKKQSRVLLPCPYCDKEVPKPDLDWHMKEACKKAPNHANSAAGSVAEDRHTGVGADSLKGLRELVDDQGRMECAVCHRWFLQDRIGKHQSICRAIDEKRKGQPHQVFDSFKQRQFDPLIRPAIQDDGTARHAGPSSKASACTSAARSYYPNLRGEAEVSKSNDRSGRPPPATPSGQRASLFPTSRQTKNTSRSEDSCPLSGKSLKLPDCQASRKAAGSLDTGAAPSRRVAGAGSSVVPVTGLPSEASREVSLHSHEAVPGTPTAARESRSQDTESPMRSPHRASQASRSDRRGPRVSESRFNVAPTTGNTPHVREGTGGVSPVSKRGSLRSPDGQVSPKAGGVRTYRERPSAAGWSSCRGTSALTAPCGAGGIVQTNESSIDNPLAYPNYPGGHYHPERSPQSLPNASRGVVARSPTAMHQRQALRGSHHAGGGGAILPTNETSAENPLARGNYYG
ncbi:hypothetical protein NCLIV_056940 [Neospora caninum Liverpool]|uniref:C2HC/C3H-type domain-containing protein n=1 Tax=Neospora caninum (strain Liverpool) TaxID=572307 RepID=F0VNH4_NEOCL|nr:hypothetical protein NCLIV_056940 [Neospora caninum Liverpool]CBZ55270.1 hypothetical protein NCLIV_056940 [Neospora caninum Liverpool]CEL70000.1 TPA: hypothetical protein BN1204_056940 [Neospora caninum Liverpool]|eukprot:XP_003885298.1 hypothetical protein NCLIV_056940 [Neospora caninum Liverpool]